MADIKRAVSAELKEDAPSEEVTQFAQITEYIRKIVTRREFLQDSGAARNGRRHVLSRGMRKQRVAARMPRPRQVFVANALGMVVAEPTLCVGCRRCEFACVAFNEGKVQPSIAKVKVNRNLMFGVNGMQQGFVRGDGIYGNFRVVQDTCRQCPHPVPCQLACPHGAIEVVAAGQRQGGECRQMPGCGICVAGLPLGDDVPRRSGEREEYKGDQMHPLQRQPGMRPACPTGALKYMAWADRTKEVPPRQIVPASIQLAADVKDTCTKCH